MRKMHPNERLELTHLYIEQIVHSGLLLDEDLEVLLDASGHVPSVPWTPSRFPFALVASASALVAAFVFVRTLRKSPGVYLGPPAIMTAVTAVRELKRRMDRREKRELVAGLIGALKDCTSLDRKVCRYVTARHKVSERSEREYFDAVNQRVLSHLRRFSENNLYMYNYITDTLEMISNVCPDLLSDYDYYKSMDPIDITKLSGDVVKLTETWCDVQVLLNSKLLSYLGVAFANYADVDRWIPPLVKHIRGIHRDNSKIFLELQDPGLKPPMKQRQKSSREFVSSKLNSSLESTLYNASFVAEKTKNILQAIDEGKDKELLNLSLLDLRDHTLATYESLDVLCRLYGIAANRTPKPPQTETSLTHTESNQPEPTTIHFDDPTEAQEENFELYIDEDLDDQQTSTLYEDASDEYVGLMLRELRHSLRQHERFREARRRRGSDEDPDETDYFDFDESDDSKRVPLPPPPPTKVEKSQEWKSDMLDSIRVISGQRRVEEETFGEAVSDGDD